MLENPPFGTAWGGNDAELRYEVLKCFTGSSMDATDDPAIRGKHEVE